MNKTVCLYCELAVFCPDLSWERVNSGGGFQRTLRSVPSVFEAIYIGALSSMYLLNKISKNIFSEEHKK